MGTPINRPTFSRERSEDVMGDYSNIPALMFVTLGIGLAIAIFLFVRMRTCQPRHPMEHQRERNIEEIREGKPPERE